MLKNAIDYLYAEWNNKAVGFVSYGNAGGARSVEHLRLVSGEPQMADVRAAGTQGPQLARLARVRPGLRGQANCACRPCQQSAE